MVSLQNSKNSGNTISIVFASLTISSVIEVNSVIFSGICIKGLMNTSKESTIVPPLTLWAAISMISS